MTIPITPPDAPTQPLFARSRVESRDQQVFIVKLVIAASLTGLGAVLALQADPLAWLAGSTLLGAMYTHMVELQHQCIHHSAFRRARLHRIVGIPLGIPLLVSYSHYRVRHLQHHRYLGTPDDSEFFGFDTRKDLTWFSLARGLFDYPRFITVLKDIFSSWTGQWAYGQGRISERRRCDVIAEYRFMGVLLLFLATLPLYAPAQPLWRLWLLPVIIATPLHFLVELPEHILCDRDTTDILLNTRSIRGSRISTWFTNGNNLHIEHHAAMTVPINRLRDRHHLAEEYGRYVEHSYPRFYWEIVKHVCRRAEARGSRSLSGEVFR